MRVLNGWHRLWLVVLIAGAAVCVAWALAGPADRNLLANRALLAIDLAARHAVEEAKQAGPREELEALRTWNKGSARIRTESYADLSDEDIIARVLDKYKGTPLAAQLRDQEAKDGTNQVARRWWFVLLWFAACLALLLAGYVAAWVRSGFSTERRSEA